MFNSQFNPGDNISKADIYEVWGDVIESAADKNGIVIDHIQQYLDDSNVWEYFSGEKHLAKDDQRPFLTLNWGILSAHIDARPFGNHLDVYGLLSIKQGLKVPDPAARVAELGAVDRRNLQFFQTILKRSIDIVLDALDNGKI